MYAKKVLFLRSILCMEDDSVYRKVLLYRMNQYGGCPRGADDNLHFSPLFDILRITSMFGMMSMAINMANRTHFYSKVMWKNEVWANAWRIDNDEWNFTTALFSDTYYLNSTIGHTSRHLVWWDVSNCYPSSIGSCEVMAAMICKASLLKSDSVEFKHTLLSMRACSNCDAGTEENMEHVIMHCEKHAHLRQQVMNRMQDFDMAYGTDISTSPDLFLYMIGKDISNVDNDSKLLLWRDIGCIIRDMYSVATKDRCGVG